MGRVYPRVKEKINACKARNQVVLTGSKHLLGVCNMIFFQRNSTIRRKGFDREDEVDEIDNLEYVSEIYLMDNYLDKEFYKFARGDGIEVDHSQFRTYVTCSSNQSSIPSYSLSYSSSDDSSY